jgi:Subtilase family/GEVED domain
MSKSRIPTLYLSALLLLFLFSGLTTSAQLQTNTAALQKASQQRTAQYKALRTILLAKAKQNNWPLTLRSKHGTIAVLRGIDKRGFPQYVTVVDNIISAATIRTNTLQPGGSSGLNLTGSSANMKGRIGIWDEGVVRPTHVELVGRVVQEDAAQGDNVLSDHSTHVSGTMIASGVNPVAKGMSPGALQLHAWDYNNDEAEMMAAASGTSGMLVSNHSYADIAGWYLDASNNDRWEFFGYPGDTVDIKFGQYDEDTQIWDSIAYNAPYYLICKAGGNNPGETGPAVGQDYWRLSTTNIDNPNFIDAGARPSGISNNAGFNTIATYGCAKNILTLGAVNPIPAGYSQPSDVVQASFTSLGPTQDGRIKPDVVADGVDVLSSISTADNAYDIYSGTSMATPATTGSAFLLQEYYQKLHSGVFMYSSTLRGLLIHTADEAGANPGPDYTYGWGLIDLQKAAAVITADNTDTTQQIKQSSLTNGTKDSESFSVVASGKMPLMATICWTDPPGTPTSVPLSSHNYMDTVRKLVNDLDLRIKNNVTGEVYMPWILNPSNPGAAATKGDNVRDNVERVELTDSAVPGRTYTITVTHKSTLQRGTQAYSLIISGVGGVPACISSSTSGGADITKVTLNNLTASIPTNSSCPGYVDNTTLTPANLPVGQAMNISVSTSSCNATNNNRAVAVYIDYNNNDTFETNELAYLGASVPAGTVTGSFTVPGTAKPGGTALMRIIAEETNDPSVISPCGTYPNGETQDFRVTFTNPPNDVGVTSLAYPTQTTCASDSQLVSVMIQNFGTVPQTAGVPVTTVISSGGTTVATLTATCLDSIPAGGSVLFTYNTSFPAVAGKTYTYLSQTALASDLNAANDTNTAVVTVNAAEAPGTGTATACGINATSVVLHANATGDDVAFWYDSPTATAPIAAGNTTSTTDITANKTYYLGMNDLQVKGGAPNKMVFTSTNQSLAGAYFRFGGNFVMFTTYVPLTIESVKMYIGHSGTIGLTLATLGSLDNNTGEYSYIPIDTATLAVYATVANPDTAQQVNVAAGNNSDTGATFLMNMPIPNPGSYIIIFNCNNYASAFLNANIATNPYPLTVPGVFSITGNDFRDYGKADSVTYSQKFYYPFYNIGFRLDGCPSSSRTAVTATSETAPVITRQGQTLVSSASTGNQWYLNNSLLNDSTSQVITPSLPGLYYTVVDDTITGCVLYSDTLIYLPDSGTANQRIGLKVGPVPSPGYFNVSFYMSASADLDIAFYDVLGQKVWEQDYGTFTGAFSQQLNTTLASGIYFMKIYFGGATYQYPVLVTH